MSEVLFIGNLLEKSGWGNYCRNMVHSLNSVGGLDVVARPVVLGKTSKVDKEIEDVIRKDSKGADFLIQIVLPHHMMYQGGIKNFGMAIVETNNLAYSDWPQYLNLMDEVWIPNSEKIEEVIKPQFIIPPPIDVKKYYKDYPTLEISNLEGRYKFYTICEYNKRKNIVGTIIAFYKAFTYDDMTALVIKVSKFGEDPSSFKSSMEEMLRDIQSRTGLRSEFPPVIFVTDFYSEEQLCGLHKYCDCYVAPSFGEAINYPLLDACGFCNPSISSNVAGPRYMKEMGLPVTLIDGMRQPCYDAEQHFPGYNSLHENWFLTNLELLSKSMKEHVGRKNEYVNMQHFSYESVGESIIERLFGE